MRNDHYESIDDCLPDMRKLAELIDDFERNRAIERSDFHAIKHALITVYNDPMYRLKMRLRERERQENAKRDAATIAHLQAKRS